MPKGRGLHRLYFDERRCYQHITSLRNNRHWVEDLQNDFNKYGEDNFEFNIVHVYDFDVSKSDEEILNELDELEKFYIKELKAFEDDGGYNLTSGGRKNLKYSNKSKHKISNSLKEQHLLYIVSLKIMLIHIS